MAQSEGFARAVDLLNQLLTELLAKTEPADSQTVTGTVAVTSTTLATQATAASLLTELQLKADLTETQPVSAATLPLPAGAATSAAQLVAGHNVTVIAPLPALVAGAANIGDVDVLTLPALVAGTANIGDVDVLTLPALVAGTANIGDVDVLTLPALVAGTANIGDVDVLTLPALVAGSANIGDVDVATLPTSGGKTITYVSVNQGAAGTTELAAASVGNNHKVVGCILVISLLGTLKFTDGVADRTGPMDLAANGGFVLSGNMIPYFQTGATNRALTLVTTLGAARGVVAILTEA